MCNLRCAVVSFQNSGTKGCEAGKKTLISHLEKKLLLFWQLVSDTHLLSSTFHLQGGKMHRKHHFFFLVNKPKKPLLKNNQILFALIFCSPLLYDAAFIVIIFICASRMSNLLFKIVTLEAAVWDDLLTGERR